MPPSRVRRHEYWIAPASEALLLGAAAIFGWLIAQPLLFTSLGPTAYEIVEKPELPSARPYNVIVGHVVGMLTGFLAVYIVGAAAAPPVSPAHGLAFVRIWAAVLAGALTALFLLLLRAGQPAALATTLLVALGQMQTFRAALEIVGGVLLIAAIGEPIRSLRLRGMGAPPA